MIMQPCIPNPCDNSPTYFGVHAFASPMFDTLAREPNTSALEGLNCPYTPSDDERNPLTLRIVAFGGWSYVIVVNLNVNYYYAEPRKNADGDCVGVDWFFEDAGTVTVSGVIDTEQGDFACDEEGEFSKDVSFQLNNGYLVLDGGEFNTEYIKTQFPETRNKGLIVSVADIKLTKACK